MKRGFLLAIIVILLLVAIPFVLAVNDLIALQGNVKESGADLAFGNLTVYIFDSLSGGNVIYNSTGDLNNSIVAGKYDVMLGNGSRELNLGYNEIYYMEVYVNNEQFSYDDGSTRHPFQSSVGQINVTHVNKTAGTHFFGETLDTIIDTLKQMVTDVNSTSVNWNLSVGTVFPRDIDYNVSIGATSFDDTRLGVRSSTGSANLNISAIEGVAIGASVGSGMDPNLIGVKGSAGCSGGGGAGGSCNPYGVYANATHYGLWEAAAHGSTYGVYSIVGGGTANYGVFVSSSSQGSSEAYTGIYLEIPSAQVNSDYGIYATGEDFNYFSGNVGIGDTKPGAPLTVSGNVNISGQVDVNDGWQNEGVSIIGGDIWAQTIYVYNISSVAVSNLEINGSLVPQIEPGITFNNTFDIGSGARVWRSGYFGTDIYIDDVGGIKKWAYNQTIDGSFDYNMTSASGWEDEGSTIHTITGTDNVGIGTASPGAALDVLGPGEEKIGIAYYLTPSSGIPNNIYGLNITISNTDYDDSVYSQYGAMVSSHTLAVAGDDADNNYAGWFNATGGNTAAYGIYATAGSGTKNWAGYFVGDVNVSSNLYVAGELANKWLYNQSTSSGWRDVGTDIILETSTDNVGIGTSSPGSTLHVVESVTSATTLAKLNLTSTSNVALTGLDINVYESVSGPTSPLVGINVTSRSVAIAEDAAHLYGGIFLVHGTSGAETAYGIWSECKNIGGSCEAVHAVGSITSTTTVSAEQLTSTDDATITDQLSVGGENVNKWLYNQTTPASTDYNYNTTIASGWEDEGSTIHTITGTDKVGIGTIPTYGMLEIKGDAPGGVPIYGINISVDDSGSGQNAYGIIIDVTESDVSGGYGIYVDIDTAAGTSYGGYFDLSGGSGTEYGIYTTGEDRNYFSGSVGIGVDKFPQTLNIAGTVNLSGTNDLYMTPGEGIVWAGAEGTYTSSDMWVSESSGFFEIKPSSSTYGIILRDYDSTSYANFDANDGYLTIGYGSADGPLFSTASEIGVGTNNPGAKFTVVGSGSETILNLTDGGTNVMIVDSSGYPYFYNAIGFEEGNVDGSPDWWIGKDNSPNNFLCMGEGAMLTGEDFCIETSSGDVGIGTGTSAISGRLQVVGDEMRVGNAGTVNSATADGDLYVEDTIEFDGSLVTTGGAGLTDPYEVGDGAGGTCTLTFTDGVLTGSTCQEGCFIAGTMINMADGTLKSIEDIEVGEYVMSYNEETGEIVASEVTSLHRPVHNYYYIIEFDDGSQMSITDNHPIYVLGKGWTSINPDILSSVEKVQLEVGDYVQKVDGSHKQIIGWIKVEEEVQTYNLHNVKDTHTFFAENTLVHNKCVAEGTKIDTIFGQVAIEDIEVGDKVIGGEVIAVYEKEMLEPIEGKILPNNEIVTNNHLVEYNNGFVRAGEIIEYEDIMIDGTVYDIKTDSGYYYVNEHKVKFG